jgi:hypothetical protein
MMNKNEIRTANYLCDLALQVGAKKHGTHHGNHYSWALGVVTALFDQVRAGADAQATIDRKCTQLEADLA